MKASRIFSLNSLNKTAVTMLAAISTATAKRNALAVAIISSYNTAQNGEDQNTIIQQTATFLTRLNNENEGKPHVKWFTKAFDGRLPHSFREVNNVIKPSGKNPALLMSRDEIITRDKETAKKREQATEKRQADKLEQDKKLAENESLAATVPQLKKQIEKLKVGQNPELETKVVSLESELSKYKSEALRNSALAETYKANLESLRSEYESEKSKIEGYERDLFTIRTAYNNLVAENAELKGALKESRKGKRLSTKEVIAA